MFYVILVTWTVMCYNEDIFLTTIVDFAVDKGIAKNMAVPLLSYLSFTDAIGRIGTSAARRSKHHSAKYAGLLQRRTHSGIRRHSYQRPTRTLSWWSLPFLLPVSTDAA
ncbi:hypothetical protein MTO96_032129 [Rhipicephalus appendiculatus]